MRKFAIIALFFFTTAGHAQTPVQFIDVNRVTKLVSSLLEQWGYTPENLQVADMGGIVRKAESRG